MILTIREEFDVLFDEHVVRALEPLGFRSQGKSVYLNQGLENVSLIRLGGRFACPGWAVWLLCFRHTFLRDRWEKRPSGLIKDVRSYPFKFQPYVLQRKASWRWRYRVTGPLLMEQDGIEWKGREATDVRDELESLSSFVEGRFLPWSQRMTPEKALWQIRLWGKNQWIEKLWISDYREFIAEKKRHGHR